MKQRGYIDLGGPALWGFMFLLMLVGLVAITGVCVYGVQWLIAHVRFV